ncbi:MAG: hypothetical protein ACI8UQ_002055, partial [Bacteroidia bacterium]
SFLGHPYGKRFLYSIDSIGKIHLDSEVITFTFAR